MKNPITQAKAAVVASIEGGETPSSLAKKAGLHRNALYGCADPSWDPKSSTLEKLWPHLGDQAEA